MITIQDSLTEALQAMAAESRKGALQASLKKAAEPLQQEMATRAPRGEKAHPHMADDIVIRAVTKVDGEAVPEGQFAVGVGPTSEHFYAKFGEYGTVHEPARPWARPAFEATKDRCLDLIGLEIYNRLLVAASKGQGPAVPESSPSTGGGLL